MHSHLDVAYTNKKPAKKAVARDIAMLRGTRPAMPCRSGLLSELGVPDAGTTSTQDVEVTTVTPPLAKVRVNVWGTGLELTWREELLDVVDLSSDVVIELEAAASLLALTWTNQTPRSGQEARNVCSVKMTRM